MSVAEYSDTRKLNINVPIMKNTSIMCISRILGAVISPYPVDDTINMAQYIDT